MKYSYRVEVQLSNKNWFKIHNAALEFCRGYLNAKKDYSPRLAHRIIRSDGKIIEEFSACEDVSIGMIVGWPTAGQYESAAKRALECAKKIRENYRPF